MTKGDRNEIKRDEIVELGDRPVSLAPRSSERVSEGDRPTSPPAPEKVGTGGGGDEIKGDRPTPPPPKPDTTAQPKQAPEKRSS